MAMLDAADLFAEVLGMNQNRALSAKPKTDWTRWLIPLIALVAVGSIVGSYFEKQPENIRIAKEWTITGPACPVLTEAQFKARRLNDSKKTTYDNVVFGRLAGHVSCNEIKTNGGKGFGVIPICQFTSPAALTVTTEKGGTTYFEPGPGSPATITMNQGVPTCVMASNFKLGD